jgi:hypothetical protein
MRPVAEWRNHMAIASPIPPDDRPFCQLTLNKNEALQLLAKSATDPELSWAHAALKPLLPDVGVRPRIGTGARVARGGPSLILDEILDEPGDDDDDDPPFAEEMRAASGREEADTGGFEFGSG